MIEEIENNIKNNDKEEMITISARHYVALLKELNKLRFKYAQRGKKTQNKKLRKSI
ncbi:hypothetical protein [Anaerosinus gibii]|uniref:Uncharacterized protein n=1 Tax=Selenobaculum gibii TaxID=3054208 RepID=A0A9Y2AJL0_9FIRM|nr:hypothetical protein [Selenobaculum gbiensis]WIW71369.1 hypothetical protein P3F81_03395 [Selenobaculum gbiensis]